MPKQQSIKLIDYIEYPFLIKSIYLDFNLCKDYVVVKSSMIIKPKLKKSSKLVLQGTKINLLSISIDGQVLESEEYNLSDKQLISWGGRPSHVYTTPVLIEIEI